MENIYTQHDERLRTMFDQWLAEMQQKCHAELLDEAKAIYSKLDDFCDAVNRTEEQKAAAAGMGGLDLGARLCGCVDKAPDCIELREVTKAVAAGDCRRGDYQREPLPPELAGMDARQLQEELLEQLLKEYEDCVLGVFLEMDKTEAVFQSGCCHMLSLFYEEMRDWLPQARLSKEELETLLGFQRPLDVLFTEYEGTGIDEYMSGSSYNDLKEIFLSARTPAPEMTMEPPF